MTKPHPEIPKYGKEAGRAVVAAFCLAALFPAGPAAAVSPGSGSSVIRVSARVEPRTDLKVIHQISELVVSEEDVRRGFLDVPQASRVEVRNNTRKEYLLVFAGLTGPFEQVFVQGLGTEIQISTAGAWTPRPYARGADRMELSYRFVLSKNTRPGTYAWPLFITARPLESPF